MIDTSNWEEFRVGELFDVTLSGDDIQPKNIKEGTIPLISSGKTNNGIVAEISDDTATLWKAGTITVDMFGKAFYQPTAYHCVSHGRVNILLPKTKISENVGLFLASVIEIVTDKYEFTEMCTGKKLSGDIIKLPATPDGLPDWAYMESYMKSVMEESEANIENLRSTDDYRHKIDTSNWKEFKISDVFVTEKHGKGRQVPTGAMIAKKDLEDGSTPRITVSNFNNGITGYYSDIDDKNYRVYENFISVSFLGTVFYQPEKASLDMKVHCLKPFEHELNEYSAGYIVSIIRKTIANFAYSDQLSSTVLADLRFKLPATPDGSPDWSYMERYMRDIMTEAEQNVLALNM